MEKLKEKIEKELKDLNEMYDFYLRKSEDENDKYINERIHELRIEIRTYEKILYMMNN